MTTASKLDLKKEFPDYYRAPRKPVHVTLPPAPFITCDGAGSPESDAFAQAVAGLYSVAYILKFSCKYAGNDFAVPALEAFWWVHEPAKVLEDPAAISSIPRDEWTWKAMIRLPDFVTEDQVREAQAQAFEKKELEAVNRVRFEMIEEGDCVQIMHMGPYADEPDTVRLVFDYMKENGLAHAERKGVGPHHEIYLSDPSRTAPEKLRTIIRIPVQPVK